MSRPLRCKLGLHRAPHPYFAAHKDGVWYGECSLCLAEIMKVGKARWRAIPKGYKIVFATSRENGYKTVPSLLRNHDNGTWPGR